MVELTPQILSRSPPSSSQTTPNYPLNCQPILIPTGSSKVNLISPNDTGNGDDDEEISFPEISKQDDDEILSAQKEDEYKIEDHPSSDKKSSLFRPVKSKYRKFKSIFSERCKVEEFKLGKFLSSFILILMLVNAAIIFSFSVYYFRNKDTDLISVNSALSYIALSLAADPILDIRLSPCPESYQKLLLGTWPGTTPGCECSNYLRSGACRKTGRGANEGSCTDVSSVDPINLYGWSGSEWCISKAKPGSQYKKAANCAEGFRKCSSGICVLETLDCPVTKVEMVGGAILTESVAGEPPVIGFAITPNDVPCFSDDHFASGPVTPYALINENENGCGKYGSDDYYSFALDKQKQEELFVENHFPNRVYSLPDYARVYKKTDSVLSYRRRLSVAEKDLCLSLETEILERSSNVTKDLNKFLFGTVIAALAIHGLLLLVVLFVSIEMCAGKPFSKILKGEEDSKIWIAIYLTGALLEYIDFLVMFAATIHYRAKMIEAKDYLTELTEEGCFLDLQAQAVVSDYQIAVNGVVENFFKYSLSIFLIGSFAVFSCGYLVWKLRK